MAFKIKDLKGKLGEIIDKLESSKGVELIEETEQEYQMWTFKGYYHLPQLNVNIGTGYFMNYESETEEYELSNNIYLIFSAKDNSFLYSEQGSTLETTIYNYCNLVLELKDFTMDNVEQLDCIYMFDRLEPLKSHLRNPDF